MNKKISAFVKKHQDVIVDVTRDAVLICGTLALYTYVCKKQGYYMSAATHLDDNYVYATTITGKKLRSPRLD